MTSSTNYFNKILASSLALTLLCLAACADLMPIQPGGSRVKEKVRIVSLLPWESQPQAALTSGITWEATAAGGEGRRHYTFEISRNGGKAVTVQTGRASRWVWNPEQAGSYRVRVSVFDARGNRSRGDWSAPYEIAPQLKVQVPAADRPSPQMADAAVIIWTAKTSGGVGKRSYVFELERDGRIQQSIKQKGRSAWTWRPSETGSYRMRVRVTDGRGNRNETEWSDAFRIEPPLAINLPTAGIAGPQMLGSVSIPWTVKASGGVGALNYEFTWRHPGQSSVLGQSGASSHWAWIPKKAGSYQVRATVTDALGHRKQSGWSEPYGIAPVLRTEVPISDKRSPQAARSAEVVWSVAAIGGVGAKQYVFWVSRDGGPARKVQSGPSPRWHWRPDRDGTYRVLARVSDKLGNEVASPWSADFQVMPPLVIQPPRPGCRSPQAVQSRVIPWSVQSSGGVGEKRYLFAISRDGGQPVSVQVGKQRSWTWKPVDQGRYRVRVTVEDRLGNRQVSPWSEGFTVVPLPVVKSLQPMKPAPQAAASLSITWSARVEGGVMPLSYLFEVEKDGKLQQPVSSKNLPAWAWRPLVAGHYRVRVSVLDARGNRATSVWSDPYEIAPPLQLQVPTADFASPQAAGTKPIIWTAKASGGVGERSYVFELEQDRRVLPSIARQERSAWTWRPQQAGRYRVRARVTDGLGNRVESAWSEPFEIAPPLAIHALMPSLPAPQMAGSGPISWVAKVSGGVGKRTFAFQHRSEGYAVEVVQKGASPKWVWAARRAGRHQVRVIVTDTLGNKAQGPWSDVYQIAPPLIVSKVKADLAGRELDVKTALNWAVEASGGVGAKTISFLLEKNGAAPSPVQVGSARKWVWTPNRAGVYRVRVMVVDALGNKVESAWSAPKEIMLPLELRSLTVDRPSPQASANDTILWTARSSGGKGKISYEFQSLKDGIEMREQMGTAPEWKWRPRFQGAYRVKVIASDHYGHRVVSDWSPAYRILPAIKPGDLLAVLPPENLSGVHAPVQKIREMLTSAMVEDGFRVLPPKQLETFMKRHRMRYTGGLGFAQGKTIHDETGVEAALITNLESYHEAGVPKITLTARLVVCRSVPQIVWIDSVGLTGDDAPGLLGLGRVKKPARLLGRAMQKLRSSFADYLAGRMKTYRMSRKDSSTDFDFNGRFEPRNFYRSSGFQSYRRYVIAILPFLNKYVRKDRSFVVPLYFLKELFPYENLRLIEPGVVRESLLKYHIIMEGGTSLAVSDALANSRTLDADLILSGEIFDYQDSKGIPKVDFSTQAFDGKKRKIVWWSRSTATGEDGVYFYDIGKILSAHGLTDGMTTAISSLLMKKSAE